MKKLLLTTLLLLSVTIAGMAQKMKNVTVTNADDFIKAIASNTNITLKISGTLKIDAALAKLDKSRDVSDKDEADYAKLAPGVYYTEEFDGRAIYVANVNNLTIDGVNVKSTHIQSNATYADVLRFAYCNNITVKNIKAGHVETGTCMGDVVVFSHCKNVKLENSDLYGCGVNGLSMANTDGVKVDNTIIHDCSENSVVMGECDNVTFNKCTMRDCGWSINDWQCSNVEYNDCDIEEHEYEGGEYDYDEGEEGGYGDYGDLGMPRDLYERIAESQDVFLERLGTDYVNGVVYADLGAEAGHLVIPEANGIYAIYIPKFLLNEGIYVCEYLDKVDTNKGGKIAFGSNHLLCTTITKQKETVLFSIEFNDGEIVSITLLGYDSNGKFIKGGHGKDPESLKECTEEEGKKHFDIESTTTIDEARECCEIYPWG